YLSQLVYPHKANPMYLIGWGNTTWDADGTLTPLFRSGSAQANYYSPDFDGLVDEAQTSVDPKRRLELYAKAQRLMLDDGAVLSLHQQMDLYGVNKRANFQALSSEQLVGVWMSLKDAKWSGSSSSTSCGRPGRCRSPARRRSTPCARGPASAR